MTIIELLVASSMGLMLMGFIVRLALTNRDIYQGDIGRTRLNQNLRSALDIISADIREAGERFPGGFPAVQITNGSGANPDELYLRRNLLDEVLVSCTNITAGTTTASINLSAAGATIPACVFPSQNTNLTSWNTYRTNNGGSITAYVFNQVTKAGEFITFSGGTNNGSLIQVTRGGTGWTWTNSYPAQQTSIYVIEDWRFRVSGGFLQLIVNGDTANPKNVIDQVTAFQVRAFMQDGTVQNTFATSDLWANLSGIEVTISGQDRVPGKKLSTRTLSAKFFPRNVLSN